MFNFVGDYPLHPWYQIETTPNYQYTIATSTSKVKTAYEVACLLIEKKLAKIEKIEDFIKLVKDLENIIS